MKSDIRKFCKSIEFDRRNFIKLLVGGAAGIHLSPLPWKITDDISIWTQNWPWVPVPAVGEFSQVTSVCLLCPGGCGIEVRKVDERAVKIEGRTDYPVNPGGICPLGAGGLQLLYNENIRYTSPMKRSGPRGSGSFEKISWDDALAELTDRITAVREKGRPEAVAAVDGSHRRSSVSLLLQRFLEALGSPNYVRVPSVEETYSLANRLMQGNAGPMAYDLENADFILSFGSGLIEGWGSPGRMINAWALWREGPPDKRPKVVQIEARASNTASKADEWVPVRPGTEAALALGLAHVIIKDRLYDKEFVHNFTHGFENWASSDGKKREGFKTMVIEKYAPDAVAKVTGLQSDRVVSLAKAFARSKAPIALCGRGKGYLNGSLFEFMSVQALNALVGNINKPGGPLVHDPLPLSPWPEIELDSIAREGLKKGRLDQAGSGQYPFSPSLINNLARAILREPKSPVDTLLLFSGNPVHTLPDGGTFRSALKKIPFIVSFSPFRDETSYMADLVLPDHTYLEKMDDIVWPTGLQYPLYGLTQPVVEPVYDTRQSGDVIIELANRVGEGVAEAFPWENFEGALMARAKGLFEADGGLTAYDESEPVWKDYEERDPADPEYESFDDMWDQIKSGGMWYRPTHTFENWKTLFKTPTGKFEFSSTLIEKAAKNLAGKGSIRSALQKLGIQAEGDMAFMPHYEATPSQVDREKYPLLLAPYELINLSSGGLPNPHFLKKTLFDHQLRREESFVEINPKTAAENNLEEGDRVIVESPRGKLRVRAHLFEGAMPGVVFLPLGFGHTAYDEYQRDQGVNPNDIIVEGRDPLSGHMVWWDTPVRLSRV